MTMTDAAVAVVRASAVDEVRAARSAVLSAELRMRDAADTVVLQGQEGWLGPAREAFDTRCLALRERLAAEEHELRGLGFTIQGVL